MSLRTPGIIGAALFLVGVAYGRLQPVAPLAIALAAGTSEAPPDNPGARPPHLLCKGGMSPRLRIILEPDRTIDLSNGDAFAASITVSNLSDQEASLAYQVEVASDTGKIVFTGTRSNTKRVAAASQQLVETVRIPQLPDGYFQVRVTAAGLVGSRDAASLGALYLQVGQRVVRVLNVNQFLAQSAANVATEGTAP